MLAWFLKFNQEPILGVLTDLRGEIAVIILLHGYSMKLPFKVISLYL